jgi:myo-inositol 2-dehydrogenase / D-chiro-inositol 1-dehydrogenase
LVSNFNISLKGDWLMDKEKEKMLTRRDFLTTGAVAATAISGFPFIKSAFASGEKPLKVGLIGCGGRGTGAVANTLTAGPNKVQLTAMGDIAADQIEKSLKALKEDPDLQKLGLTQNVKVAKDHIFVGMDAFQKVLQTDVDYVILTAPPGFRPQHFEAAVQAGKHIFAEKPLATDPVGCRKIRVSAQTAKTKSLSVVVGLNARHDKSNIETVNRIHDGGIGKILAGRIYRLGGGLWHRGSDPKWTPMEYQCRNWYYFDWLSGDQIVEMVVHQIDLMNWTMNAHPVSALAQGGRQVRTDKKYGNIFDHMSVDYEYPEGVHVTAIMRQWENCDSKYGNVVIGPLGESDAAEIIKGQNKWKYRGEKTNATVYEHVELLESMKKKDGRNDALDFGIDSTLTAVMGRESAYTGKLVTWEEMMTSNLDLFPKNPVFGPAPDRPVAMPGQPRPV